MNTGRHPRSAAVSAADQPQRPRNVVGARGNQTLPVRSTCCGWCSAHTAALRAKPSRAARILPWRWQGSDHRRMVADAWLLVPEGHRRRLAGGKPAPAGAAPGRPAERGLPQRGIGEVFAVVRPATSPPLSVASGRSGRRPSPTIHGHFFDAPLGHGATRHRNRGPRPLAQTGPRLISSGVPPGREPGGHTLTKGNHRRGYGVLDPFGSGFSAWCSTYLCGSSGAARLNRCG